MKRMRRNNKNLSQIMIWDRIRKENSQKTNYKSSAASFRIKMYKNMSRKKSSKKSRRSKLGAEHKPSFKSDSKKIL